MKRAWYVQTTPSTWVGVRAWLRPPAYDPSTVHSAAEHQAYLRYYVPEHEELWPVTTFGFGVAAGVAAAYCGRYGL